jgi:hypothetical protein
MKVSKCKNLANFDKTLVIPNQTRQVLFYSRFECGNLLRVVRKSKIKQDYSFTGIEQRNNNFIHFEYDLYLDSDTNSEGHMHWFYF